METQHTPGPWKVEQGEYPHESKTVITAYHAGMTRRSPLALLSNIIGKDECETDARLIAAAPDLLEALEAVLRVADRKTAEFDMARAAIAKATGGAA